MKVVFVSKSFSSDIVKLTVMFKTQHLKPMISMINMVTIIPHTDRIFVIYLQSCLDPQTVHCLCTKHKNTRRSASIVFSIAFESNGISYRKQNSITNRINCVASSLVQLLSEKSRFMLYENFIFKRSFTSCSSYPV